MQRIKPLDSLRGLAALTVLFAQCYSIWPEDARQELSWLNHTPLRILINGHAAVTLFFVLSGFVLALPFFRGQTPGYAQFAVRRLCRIYVPFAVSIILALLLYWIAGGRPVAGAGQWFNEKWANGFSLQDVLLHLAMTGRTQDMALNHNIWTLVHELRVALIFPLLIALCASSKRAIYAGIGLFIVCTGIMVALSPATDEFFIDTAELWITFLITGRCIGFFLAGILLAKHQDMLMQKLATLPGIVKMGIWGLCLAVLAAPHFPQEDILQGAVAALAILLVMVQPRLGVWLSSAPILWLGRVSYSLYLVHLPILFALFHLLLGRLSFGAVTVIGIAASLIAAQIMHVLVERPAIRFARRVTQESGQRVAAGSW